MPRDRLRRHAGTTLEKDEGTAPEVGNNHAGEPVAPSPPANVAAAARADAAKAAAARAALAAGAEQAQADAAGDAAAAEANLAAVQAAAAAAIEAALKTTVTVGEDSPLMKEVIALCDSLLTEAPDIIDGRGRLKYLERLEKSGRTVLPSSRVNANELKGTQEEWESRVEELEDKVANDEYATYLQENPDNAVGIKKKVAEVMAAKASITMREQLWEEAAEAAWVASNKKAKASPPPMTYSEYLRLCSEFIVAKNQAEAAVTRSASKGEIRSELLDRKAMEAGIKMNDALTSLNEYFDGLSNLSDHQGANLDNKGKLLWTPNSTTGKVKRFKLGAGVWEIGVGLVNDPKSSVNVPPIVTRAQLGIASSLDFMTGPGLANALAADPQMRALAARNRTFMDRLTDGLFALSWKMADKAADLSMTVAQKALVKNSGGLTDEANEFVRSLLKGQELLEKSGPEAAAAQAALSAKEEEVQSGSTVTKVDKMLQDMHDPAGLGLGGGRRTKRNNFRRKTKRNTKVKKMRRSTMKYRR